MNRLEKLIDDLQEDIVGLKNEFAITSIEEQLKIKIKIETMEDCVSKIVKSLNVSDHTEMSSITGDGNSFTSPLNRNNSDSSSTHTQNTHSDDSVRSAIRGENNENDISPRPPVRKTSSLRNS